MLKLNNKNLLILILISLIFTYFMKNICCDLYHNIVFNKKSTISQIENILKTFNFSNKLNILDFGSGKDLLFNNLNKKHNITSLDVKKYSNKTIIYNGHNIPYSDKYFDIGVAMYTLHHIPHQVEMLKELKRTCKYIILIEDSPDKYPIKFLSYLVEKKHFHSFNQESDMIKYVHTDNEWRNIFNQLHLNCLHQNYFQASKYYPVINNIYLLH